MRLSFFFGGPPPPSSVCFFLLFGRRGCPGEKRPLGGGCKRFWFHLVKSGQNKRKLAKGIGRKKVARRDQELKISQSALETHTGADLLFWFGRENLHV